MLILYLFGYSSDDVLFSCETGYCTFARLAVVMFPECFVFRDVRVEEFKRVFWHDPVGDHLVVTDNISERQSTQPALCVRFHRIELWLTCRNTFIHTELLRHNTVLHIMLLSAGYISAHSLYSGGSSRFR